MPTVCGWDPPDHSGKKSSDRLSPPESKTKIYFQSILTTETIYEIDITAQGKKATVFHASPWCPQIGFPWCGSGGCTSYVILDGVSFETWGSRPVSVSVSDYRVVVIVPRSGGGLVLMPTVQHFPTVPAALLWLFGMIRLKHLTVSRQLLLSLR